MTQIVWTLAIVFLSLSSFADDLLDLLDGGAQQTVESSSTPIEAQTPTPMVIAESDLGKWILEVSKKESDLGLSSLVSLADKDNFVEVAKRLAADQDILKLSAERKAIFAYSLMKMNQTHVALTLLSEQLERSTVSPAGLVLLDREINKIPTQYFLLTNKVLKAEWVKPEAKFAYGWANLSPDAASDKIIQLIQSAPSKKEREALFFRLGSQYILENQLPQAVKIFKKLSESAESADLKDAVNLQIARLLYAERHFSPSLEYYRRISAQSPFYFTALEEKGWVNLSMGLVREQAESTHEILDSPVAQMLTPEFYVQKAVGEIKMCQYSRALDTIVAFKGEIKKRENKINELVRRCSEDCIALLDKVFKSGNVQPLAEYRSLRSSSAIRNHYEASKIYVNEPALVPAIAQLKVGDTLMSDFVKSKQNMVRSELSAMVLREAEADRDELNQSVKRMYVADAEVAQQVLLSDRKPAAEKRFAVNKPSLFSDKVTFKDDSEIWLDEISHYKVEKESVCESK